MLKSIRAVVAYLLIAATISGAWAADDEPKWTIKVNKATALFVDSLPAWGPGGYGSALGTQSEHYVEGDYRLLVVFPEVTITWNDPKSSIKINRKDVQLASPKMPFVDPKNLDDRGTTVYRIAYLLSTPRYKATSVVGGHSMDYISSPSKDAGDHPVLQTTLGPYAFAIPTSDLDESFTLRIGDAEAKVALGATLPVFDPAKALKGSIAEVAYVDEVSIGANNVRQNLTNRVRTKATRDGFLLVRCEVEALVKDLAINSNEFSILLDGTTHVASFGMVHSMEAKSLNKTKDYTLMERDGTLAKQEIILVFHAPKSFKSLDFLWIDHPLATHTP